MAKIDQTKKPAGPQAEKLDKERIKSILGQVPEDKVFWCHEGCIFRDLQELQEAFEDMSDETFAYHANSDKKDFSRWVEDVIGDAKLAKDLEAVSTHRQAAKIVEQRLALLSDLAR